MKLRKIEALLFLVISVNALPTEEVHNEQIQASTKVFVTEEEIQNDEMNDDSTIDLDGEGTTPSVRYMEEVTQYFQQKKDQKKLRRVTRQNNEEILQHNNTIALQSFMRNKWASCSSEYCNGNPCPRMHMAGKDWTSGCWGEVFRIYRADGPGEVQVGDLVGIYYPRQRGRWLGCAGSSCAKAICPGNPTNTHGFATEEKWYQCWGEVFKIYATGKSLGDTINSDDDVAFFYLQEENWVALGLGNIVKKPCLGTNRPPSLTNYDGCAHEVFRLWKN